MNRKYKRRKFSPLKSLIIFLLIVLSALVVEKLIYSFTSLDNSKNIVEAAKEDNHSKKDDKKHSENISSKKKNWLKKLNKSKLNEYKPQPTDHKKGTSHNYEATAWAYKCKDVSNWINNPSSYTGEDKLVFLTFDDGPSEIYTNTVLDILKNYGVHATFFIVGSAADKDHAKPILEREMKEGHAIGLHSYTHNYSHLYPNRVGNTTNILEEVEKNRLAIAKSLGEDFYTTIFRYPGGHMSWKNLNQADEALVKKGIHNIDWNVLTGDAEAAGSRRDLQGALANIKEDMTMRGNPKVVVVLMHDMKAKSVNELPQIIEYFSSLGYKFGILT